jgi:hypothetical protein
MDNNTMSKIETILEQGRVVYNLFGREIRLEFYPSDNYLSVSLYDIDDNEESSVDVQLSLDDTVEFLNNIISNKRK